ncbi:MAG TPA: 30S ribosomal protein S17 [Patescibacteria group bacterium]|nr:30S ribosomal protein S17 [Patescibacteria group bacterium]
MNKQKTKLSAVALRDAKEKTVLVRVETFKKHPLYKIRSRTSRKFLVHAETEVKCGDHVFIEECRPQSKRKTWRVSEVKK